MQLQAESKTTRELLTTLIERIESRLVWEREVLTPRKPPPPPLALREITDQADIPAFELIDSPETVRSQQHNQQIESPSQEKIQKIVVQRKKVKEKETEKEDKRREQKKKNFTNCKVPWKVMETSANLHRSPQFAEEKQRTKKKPPQQSATPLFSFQQQIECKRKPATPAAAVSEVEQPVNKHRRGKVVSYTEPSLRKKLRKGDEHTFC